MKQSGYEWFHHLSQKMKSLGLMEHEWSETLFMKQTSKGMLMIALYVDGLFLVAESESILQDFKAGLQDIFDLMYFGEASEYLGIEFHKTPEGYVMSQVKFLENCPTEFDISSRNKRRIPMRYEDNLSKTTTNPEVDKFYEMTGDTSEYLGENQTEVSIRDW